MKIAGTGLDISKQWFDACVLIGEERHERRFPNNKAGCRRCLKWLESLGQDRLNVVLEPTGHYSDLIADYLYGRETMALYMVNPVKMSDFRKSLEQRISTDRIAAYAMAVYADERAAKPERYGLKPYVPKTAIQKQLRDLKVRLRSLLKRKSTLLCQLDCGIQDEFVLDDTREELAEIVERYERMLKKAQDIIEQSDQLKEDFARLVTVIGIGETTAIALLCLIDFRSFATSRDLCCFLGFTVRKKESGSSVKGKERISKAGSKYIRAALYFPALTAMQHNPQLRDFAERLSGKGKIHPVVRTAVSRKLVAIAWSLVNKNCDFDPAYAASAN